VRAITLVFDVVGARPHLACAFSAIPSFCAVWIAMNAVPDGAHIPPA
jgi:hypothetical protein